MFWSWLAAFGWSWLAALVVVAVVHLWLPGLEEVLCLLFEPLPLLVLGLADQACPPPKDFFGFSSAGF